MRVLRTFPALAGLLLASGTFATTSAAADPLADFYRGKQMQMIVATSPGGDYDTRARLLARHIGRHIPGEPTVIARNMPGGVGVAAANYMMGVAPKDGTALHAIMQGMAALQATGGQSQVEFDVTKFSWIGNTTDSPNIINSWHTTGITRIEQVFTQELVVGAPGTATSSVYYPLALNVLVGTKFKIISGYPGGNDVNVAMERGEVGGRGSNSLAAWKATRPHWLKEGKVHFLVQIGLKRHPELPDVPLFFELAKNEDDRQVLRFLSADIPLSRAIVTTPGVPADRVAALRRAFDLTMKDAAFLAEADKGQIDISPSSGVDAEKIVAEIVNAPAAVRARAKAILDGKAN